MVLLIFVLTNVAISNVSTLIELPGQNLIDFEDALLNSLYFLLWRTDLVGLIDAVCDDSITGGFNSDSMVGDV